MRFVVGVVKPQVAAPSGAATITTVSVELGLRYSNHHKLLSRLTRTWGRLQRELEAANPEDNLLPRSAGDPNRRQTAVTRRLSAAQIEQLVQGYRTGQSTRELAERYGISKTSVTKLLGAHGVGRRQQPMSEAQLVEAARLYQEGSSVVVVSEALGVPPTTVWEALRRAGVPLRPRRGWEKRR